MANTRTDFKMMEDFSRLCWANCWTSRDFIKSTSGHQHNCQERVYSQARKWPTIHQPWVTTIIRTCPGNQTKYPFNHVTSLDTCDTKPLVIYLETKWDKQGFLRCFFNGQTKSLRFSLSCLDLFHPIYISARISDKTWILDFEEWQSLVTKG